MTTLLNVKLLNVKLTRDGKTPKISPAEVGVLLVRRCVAVKASNTGSGKLIFLLDE